MATYTAQILVGHGHPNDDGLVGPSVVTFWLIENSRSCWVLQPRPHLPPQRMWLCRSKESTLVDGLAMVVDTVGAADDLDGLAAGHAHLPRPRQRDLTSLTEAEHAALINVGRRQAADLSLKLVVAALHGSAIRQQLDVLRCFDLDVEVLEPSGVRLWSRWLTTIRRTGLFAQVVH